MERFFTVNELADLLKLNAYTLRDILRSGKLRAVKIGRTWRISETAVNEYLQKNEVSELTIEKAQ